MSTLEMTWVDNGSYTGWKKMIGGKVHYFGRDKAAAEIKLLQALLLDRTGQRCETCEEVGGETTSAALDAYVEHTRTLPASPAWRQTMRQRIARARNYLPDCPFSALTYDTLTATVNKIRGERSYYTSRNLVQILKMFLNWAADGGKWVPFPRWERPFKMPRRKCAQLVPVMLTLEEFGTMYRAAPERMKCWLLIMANTGATNADLATLERKWVDLKNRRITRPRQKTGILGSWQLWDCTVAALEKWMNKTGTLAFTTENGRALQRYTDDYKTDMVGSSWTHLSKRTGIRKGVRAIRKMGAQIIREVADLETAQLYLAHVGSSVAERHYTSPVQSKLDQALLLTERPPPPPPTPTPATIFGAT